MRHYDLELRGRRRYAQPRLVSLDSRTPPLSAGQSNNVLPPRETLLVFQWRYERLNGLEQLEQVLRELVLMTAQEARHSPYLGDCLACSTNLFRSRASTDTLRHIVTAGAYIGRDTGTHLFCLTLVVFQTTR